MSAATYDFAQYLAQVPGYKRKDDATLQNRATTSANLVFDPQKSEQERQVKTNEMQSIINTQKLKRANVGIDEALAYSNSQAKKANAIRAVGSGAVGSSGLSDYLNSLADTSMQTQKLNVAANMRGSLEDEALRYSDIYQQSQGKLGEIEKLRGQTSSSLYNTLEDAQDTAENSWNQNALQVALGIGSGQMQAADLNGRQANEAARIAESRYEAELPYNKMTKAQEATESRLTVAQQGGVAPNPNTATSIRSYVEGQGGQVQWNANDGSVTVGNTTLTAADLAKQGKLVNGRWQLPLSTVQKMMVMQ